MALPHICAQCYNNDGAVHYCENRCNICGNTKYFLSEKDLGLTERKEVMQYQSQEVDKLFTALSKAQGMFKTVGYSKTAKIKSQRTGAEFTYRYATLSSIMDMIRTPLAENELVISQQIIEENLVTVLGHSSGQFISSSLKLSDYDDIKTLGANISYLRRYALSALLGVTVDEEDDEEVASGKMQPQQIYAPPQRQSQTPPYQRPAQPPAPPAPPVTVSASVSPVSASIGADTAELLVTTSELKEHSVGEVKQTLLSLGYGTSIAQNALIAKLFGEQTNITSLTPIQQYNLFEYAKRSKLLDNTTYTPEQRLGMIPEINDMATPAKTLGEAKEFLVSTVHLLTSMNKPMRPLEAVA